MDGRGLQRKGRGQIVGPVNRWQEMPPRSARERPRDGSRQDGAGALPLHPAGATGPRPRTRGDWEARRVRLPQERPVCYDAEEELLALAAFAPWLRYGRM